MQIAGRQYEFGLDELVFDHGHGGRVKWARQTLVPEGAHHYYGGVSAASSDLSLPLMYCSQDAAVPALQEERTRLLEGAGVRP